MTTEACKIACSKAGLPSAAIESLVNQLPLPPGRVAITKAGGLLRRVVYIPNLGLYLCQPNRIGMGSRIKAKELNAMAADSTLPFLVWKVIRIAKHQFSTEGSSREAIEQELEMIQRLRDSGVAVPQIVGRYSKSHAEVIIEPRYRSLTGNLRVLSQEQKICIVGQLIRNCSLMHKANVIHGDIKPDNIMLDDTGKVIISDFDQAFDPQKAQGSVGTPAFSSPEVLDVDCCIPIEMRDRRDVYALGLTVAQMEFPDAMVTKIHTHLQDHRLCHRLIKLMIHPDPVIRPTMNQITNWEERIRNEFVKQKPL